MSHWLYLPVIVISYLVGTSNMAYYLSKWKGVDLQSAGSKNLGASNTLILMGLPEAAAVLIHDMGKATLCVLAAQHFLPDLPAVGAVAGVCAVLGHMYPFWLRLKGGKGFASYLGMTLALNWKFFLILLLAVVIVTVVSDYVVLGTVTTMITVPIYMGISRSLLFCAVLCIASGIILYKHRENYVRIWKGTEIGLRRAKRGDDRLTKKDEKN